MVHFRCPRAATFFRRIRGQRTEISGQRQRGTATVPLEAEGFFDRGRIVNLSALDHGGDVAGVLNMPPQPEICPILGAGLSHRGQKSPKRSPPQFSQNVLPHSRHLCTTVPGLLFPQDGHFGYEVIKHAIRSERTAEEYRRVDGEKTSAVRRGRIYASLLQRPTWVKFDNKTQQRPSRDP
jgi:hypothetical protein